MASDTNKAKVQKARSAGELFNNIQQAVDANRVPQLAEFLQQVSDRIGVEEIADVMATTIRDGSDAVKRKFALEYANLLRQFQQMTGEMTKDEISKMSDMQIDAILRDEYGIGKVESTDGTEGTEGPTASGTGEPESV